MSKIFNVYNMPENGDGINNDTKPITMTVNTSCPNPMFKKLFNHFRTQNNNPLIGANAYIEDAVYGAATDLDGTFLLLNVPEGDYQLIVAEIYRAIQNKKSHPHQKEYHAGFKRGLNDPG